jgi:transcription antitermination factor NusG
MCQDGTPGGISYSPEAAAGWTNWALNGGSAQWFALSVKPRFDKVVAQALETKGYDTLLPLYRKQHKYGTRSRDSELPLFPGYVCCRFNVHARLPVLTTPGVIQILGVGNIPSPLSDVEVQSLQTAMKARFPVEPYPFVEAGRKVRINGGALSGVEGIVISCNQRLRLVLSITLLRRSVLLEIDRDQVSSGGDPDWRERDVWTASSSLGVVRGD